jgi:hypothetical protein
MATKPTREQQKACDLLVEAVLQITEGARLDGKGGFGREDLREVTNRLAKASSAFRLDEILARALERRCRALGLRSEASDLLTLLDPGIEPLEALRLSDDALRELVEKAEGELGGL